MAWRQPRWASGEKRLLSTPDFATSRSESRRTDWPRDPSGRFLHTQFAWLGILRHNRSRQTAAQDDSCPDEKKHTRDKAEKPFPVLHRVAKYSGETSSVSLGDQRHSGIAESTAQSHDD